MGDVVKRSSRLRQRSVKRQVADAELRVSVEQRRRMVRDWCEGTPDACGTTRPHRGDHAHHIVTRARGGDHSVENLRWLCFDAHRWVHDHPAEAAEHGLLARREGLTVGIDPSDREGQRVVPARGAAGISRGHTTTT